MNRTRAQLFSLSAETFFRRRLAAPVCLCASKPDPRGVGLGGDGLPLPKTRAKRICAPRSGAERGPERKRTCSRMSLFPSCKIGAQRSGSDFERKKEPVDGELSRLFRKPGKRNGASLRQPTSLPISSTRAMEKILASPLPSIRIRRWSQRLGRTGTVIVPVLRLTSRGILPE